MQVCCTQSPYSRPQLTCTSTGDTQTQFWLSLCGLGWHFVPFPCLSSSGVQVLGERTVPGEPWVLMTSLVPDTWFPGCSTRAPFQVCCISPLESYLRLQASWRVWTIQDLRKTSAKTRPGADCGSDHELPIAKFRLKLKKVKKNTRPFRYDLNLIPYDYAVEVRNRFKG